MVYSAAHIDATLIEFAIARAFNSEHQVSLYDGNQFHFSETILVQKMELINECSIRFAEDKDFRLLVTSTVLSRMAFLYSSSLDR